MSNNQFTLPLMVQSPWNKTVKTLIPEPPVDDSTYWRVKGGRAAEIVWGFLEEQASRVTKYADYLRTLRVVHGRDAARQLVPSQVVTEYGRLVGILSSEKPAEHWVEKTPTNANLAKLVGGDMKYWCPDESTPGGRVIIAALEQFRPADQDRLHFALFGDHGSMTFPVTPAGTPKGMHVTLVSVYCFVHAGARPQAYLRVSKAQNFINMSAEVRAGLEQIPGSRFWRIVETEHTTNRELKAALAKASKTKPKGKR